MSSLLISRLLMARTDSPISAGHYPHPTRPSTLPHPTPYNPLHTTPLNASLFYPVYHSHSTAIDWDHISKSTPPMKPSAKDINTATQSEIGSFQDEKISKKLILTEDDHKTYEKWEFLSKRSFQEEVVDFLTFEEKVVSFILFFIFYFYFYLFYFCFFVLFAFLLFHIYSFFLSFLSCFEMIKYLIIYEN